MTETPQPDDDELAWLLDILAPELFTALKKPCFFCGYKTQNKATTIISDIPACEPCAREYQAAEDKLGNEDSED